jgi:hypothetical protein
MMTAIRFHTLIRWDLIVSIGTEIVLDGIARLIPIQGSQTHRVMTRGQVPTIGEDNAFVCMKYAYKIGGQGVVANASTSAQLSRSGRSRDRGLVRLGVAEDD